MSTGQTSPSMLNRWLGLIRFSHTIFALPFAALATVMALTTPLSASGTIPQPRWRDAIGILLCMVFARSAAMAFNRLVDHRLDASNPRTASRHLPAGLLSRPQVIAFTLACSAGFIASTLLFLPNRVPLILSFPVLLFLLGYSLAKRFTAAAHVWLGVALSLSPICAWLAIRGYVSIADLVTPGLLAAVVAAWVTGFDVLYACQDADFDRGAGLHSVPARLGITGALSFSAGCHIGMLVLLVLLAWAGQSSGLGILFAAALVFVAGLIIRQHRLVRPNDLSRVNEAFFAVNGQISVILLVAGVADCLL